MAIESKSVIQSCYKPKPYKDYKELTENESYVVRNQGHLIILFIGDKDGKEKQRQSTINDICRLVPEIARKHGLVSNTEWEYWR